MNTWFKNLSTPRQCAVVGGPIVVLLLLSAFLLVRDSSGSAPAANRDTSQEPISADVALTRLERIADDMLGGPLAIAEAQVYLEVDGEHVPLEATLVRERGNVVTVLGTNITGRTIEGSPVLTEKTADENVGILVGPLELDVLDQDGRTVVGRRTFMPAMLEVSGAFVENGRLHLNVTDKEGQPAIVRDVDVVGLLEGRIYQR